MAGGIGLRAVAARFDGGVAAWSVTGIAFGSAFVAWGAVFYGHSFYLAALQARHGWSASLISTAILGFWLAGILATMAVGRAIDRGGPALVLAWGGLSIGGGVIALGLLQAPWQLFLVYALLGAGYPALATATISGALNRWFERRYGLALSLALSGASVGGAVLPPLMVWLAARQGFSSATLAVGVGTLATMLPLALWLHRLGRAAPARPGSIEDRVEAQRAGVLRRPAFWIITLASSLALGAQVGFLSHQIPLLSGGIGEQAAAFMVSATALSAAIGRLVAGALSGVAPLRLLAAASYLVQATGYVVLIYAGGVPARFLGCVLAGFVVGAIVMLPPLLLREAFGVGRYGRIYGYCNVGLFVGAGLGPAAAGWLRDWTGDYSLSLWVLTAAHLAAAIVIAGHRRRRP